LDIILPAGGIISGEFAAETKVESKALISLGGKTVLERTIETVRATGRAEKVIVIGPDDVAAHPAAACADSVLPACGSGPDNIFRGLWWLKETNCGVLPERILVITTDLPFLSVDALNAFLDKCPSEKDICLPLVRKEAFQTRFPGSTNTYVRLQDGEWTMGCAFLLNPEAMESGREHIDRAFSVRKSQFGMAKMLGLGFIIKFLAGRLTVNHIEDRCQRILGCSATAIRDCAPELAYDLDMVEEYRYALTEETKINDVKI